MVGKEMETIKTHWDKLKYEQGFLGTQNEIRQGLENEQGKASLGRPIEDSRETVHIIFNISLFIVFD